MISTQEIKYAEHQKYPSPRQNETPQLLKLSSCLLLGDEMGPLGTLSLAVSLHTSIQAILCQLLNAILQCYAGFGMGLELGTRAK